MSRESRLARIKTLEKLRSSRVLCYVMADRPAGTRVPGLSLQMTAEAQAWIYGHLRKIGKVEKLDLFLYTRGGHTDCVWPLVNMLRGHCKKLGVLVPFRAHSAGTLLCLGANEVVMGPAAEISPVDPTTGNVFNPPDEFNPGARKGISVEDVAAYMALARDEKKVNLKQESSILEVFKKLTDQVHPLALGNVQRTHTQIRQLSSRLLALHSTHGSKKVGEIVDTLTEKLYSHLHAIGCEEAKKLLGDQVVQPTEEIENAMWLLYEDYAGAMRLKERFNILDYMGGQTIRDIELVAGFIESEGESTAYVATSRISLLPDMPIDGVFRLRPNELQQNQPIPSQAGFSSKITVETQKEGWENNASGV